MSNKKYITKIKRKELNNMKNKKQKLKIEIINNLIEFINNEQYEYERIASELGITEEDMDIQTFLDDFTMEIKLAVIKTGSQ
jgi:thiaminase